MVTKGIITELIGKTQAKVRIPIYDKSSAALDGTPDSELSSAIMCTFPGGSPNYSVGDIVIVGFEQDIYTQPVIIGLLFTGTESKTLTDMHVGKLKVNVAAQLPSNTYIGTISPFDLQNLAGPRGNLQNQIDNLTYKTAESKGWSYYIDAENRNLVFEDMDEVVYAEELEY